MEKHRKQYTAEFKLKVVLESLQRDTTIEEVRTKFGVSTSMIHRWRQEFQAKATLLVHSLGPGLSASGCVCPRTGQPPWLEIPAASDGSSRWRRRTSCALLR